MEIMKLSQIGERRIVEEITKKFSIPIDDCAIIENGNEYILITTDMVNEKKHFPNGAKPYHMGWYSIAVNLSDIAAKGGNPIALTAAISIPRNYEISFLNEILDGMGDCIKNYGGKLIGGDTKESDVITIAVTAIGKVNKNEYMARYGAKEGDALYVTGDLGKEASLYLNDLDSLLLIKPRIKEGRELAKLNAITSCMDLSDGLASSLYQLKKINGVGFILYEDWLPISKQAMKMKNPLEFTLYHGGDFELLFTMPEKYEKDLKIDFKKIGYVIKEKKILIYKNGKKIEIENKGYEHFIS